MLRAARAATWNSGTLAMGMCSHMLCGDCPDSRLSSLLVVLRPGRGLGLEPKLESMCGLGLEGSSVAGARLAPLLHAAKLAAPGAGLPSSKLWAWGEAWLISGCRCCCCCCWGHGAGWGARGPSGGMTACCLWPTQHHLRLAHLCALAEQPGQSVCSCWSAAPARLPSGAWRMRHPDPSVMAAAAAAAAAGSGCWGWGRWVPQQAQPGAALHLLLKWSPQMQPPPSFCL